MLTIAKRKTKIGPEDHGRKMSLKDYEFVETQEGYHYELSRGYITVSEFPELDHAMVLVATRDQLIAYQMSYPGMIYVVFGVAECKLVIPEWESERRPDLAIYLTKPQKWVDRTFWRRWIPELAIEVVSERSTDRDYIDKRQEYFDLGIKEYWIIDAMREQAVVLRRGKSDWIEKRIGPDSVITTKLLPGFALPFKAIMDAAAQAGIDEE